MSLRSALLATTAFLAAANAHMIMEKPVPYSVDKIDNSPITKAQFPCKSQDGFTVSSMNSMKVGDTQQLAFKGSAVHGGGSCQLSVTLDTEPTANSKFKVIKSIEGGCPGVSGPNSYEFTLPDSIPNGKATFAWTWFSKLSGQPELYMNCAPIEVTGGASDDSAFNQLPDMFVANIDNTCTSPQNFATKFPNPGSVVQNGGTNDLKEPTGSGCGASSGGSSPAPSSGGSAAPAPSAAPSSAPSAAPQPSSAPVSSAPAAPEPSNPGGVFAPGASSAAQSPAPSTLVTQPASSAPAPSAPAPSAPAPSAPAPSAPAPSASAPSAPVGTAPVGTAPIATGSPAAPTGAPSTGAPSAGGNACSQNGAIVCNGPTQFGLCNNGSVVWQAVAAGTTCSNGAIQKRQYHGRIVRTRAVIPGKDFTPDN